MTAKRRMPVEGRPQAHQSVRISPVSLIDEVIAAWLGGERQEGHGAARSSLYCKNQQEAVREVETEGAAFLRLWRRMRPLRW